MTNDELVDQLYELAVKNDDEHDILVEAAGRIDKFNEIIQRIEKSAIKNCAQFLGVVGSASLEYLGEGEE